MDDTAYDPWDQENYCHICGEFVAFHDDKDHDFLSDHEREQAMNDTIIQEAITYPCGTWQMLGELLMYGHDPSEDIWNLGQFIDERSREAMEYLRGSERRNREPLTLHFGTTRPLLAKAEAILAQLPLT